MKINLASVSPISFEFSKMGDLVSLTRKKANKNEYRSSIGAAKDSILVMRGRTKIGMIPLKIFSESADYLSGKRTATVVSIDPERKVITIEV